MFEVFPIKALSDNYVWTLVEGEQAIIVDPGDAKPVLETFKKLELDLKAIIITHHHFDHTGGIQELKDQFDCDVYVSLDLSLALMTTWLNLSVSEN